MCVCLASNRSIIIIAVQRCSVDIFSKFWAFDGNSITGNKRIIGSVNTHYPSRLANSLTLAHKLCWACIFYLVHTQLLPNLPRKKTSLHQTLYLIIVYWSYNFLYVFFCFVCNSKHKYITIVISVNGAPLGLSAVP